MTMKRRWAGFLFFTCLMLSAVTAGAQIAADKLPRRRTIPIRDEIKRQIEESRFHLGPMRVTPVFALRNVGYNNNIFGTPDNVKSDYAATISAGVKTITPFGRKVFLLADVLPEYTWYAKYGEQNHGGQQLRGSLLGLFNRLSTDLTVEESKVVALISSETERPAQVKRSRQASSAELEIFERLSIFGGAEAERLRFTRDEVPGVPSSGAQDLDRDENAFRGGVRYRFASYFDVSAQVEKTRAEFDFRPQSRDTQTTAYLVGVHYDRPKLFVNLAGGQRKGESFHGSSVPSFSGTTGSYFVSYALSRSAVDVYGNRDLVFGLSSPFFFETRTGAALNLRPGNRLFFRLFGEVGNNQYPTAVLLPDGERIKRSDGVTTYGLGIGFRLFRKAALTILASNSDYNSNIDEFSRHVLRTTVGLSFSGEFNP